VPLAKARSARFAKATRKPEPVTTGPVIEEIESYYSVVVNSNVREKPTAKSDRVGRIKAGDLVIATGKVKNSNWYRIESGEGMVGFIYGELVKKATPTEVVANALGKKVPPPEPEESKPETATVALQVAPEPTPTQPPAKAPAPEPAVAPVQPQSAPEPAKAATATEPTTTEPAAAQTTNEPAKKEQVQAPAQESELSQQADQGATEQQAAVLIPNPQPIPSKAPPKSGGETIRDCADCPEMVAIEPGQFMMGSRFDAAEQPAHRVTIEYPFALSKYEVTYGSWKSCVADGACAPIAKLKDASDDVAVRNVSWRDANQFTEWLRKKTGKPYRLPTESEWEYAARSDSDSAFWWGEEMMADAVSCRGCATPSSKRPEPVGSFPANPFGLHDMNGGVWEWVSDCWHSSYAGHPADGTSWESSDCRQRVLRGGSWRNDPSYLRSASRFYYDATVRYSVNGFRVALTLQ